MTLSVKNLKTLFLAAGVVALAGCGGGGGGGSSSVAPQPEVLTGRFVDSCVEGVTYKTPTQNGKTGPDCGFKYLPGE